jgi:hypothetical protein
MGPTKNPTNRPAAQGDKRRPLAWRPRARRCLLKGCERQFHPRQARQRYCSPECRAAARRWCRWKAQQRYRATLAGQQQRNGQSRRYRERVRSRKPPEPEAVSEAARVIPPEDFFRFWLRPAGLLRAIRVPAAKSFTAFLLLRLPESGSACPRTRAALEQARDLIRRY